MWDRILGGIVDKPIEFAVAVAIVIIAFALSFKLVGNPLTYIIDKLGSMIPAIVKEITGKAGMTGKLNALIIFLTFFLSLSLILKQNITAFLVPEGVDASAMGFVVFLVTVAVFIASLRIVMDTDRMGQLYHDTEA